ncbi:MAG: prepilin-type N-terminal cleavage/methylation domain-containing protein, partial [Pseudomonadota bacterium]
MTQPGHQRGVGLIEVMTALFILAFAALAISNVQITALSGVTISTSHFAISTISEEIAEHLKADPAQAADTAFPPSPTAVHTT